MELPVLVPRFPVATSRWNHQGLVVHHGGGRDAGATALRLEGGQVNEGLEERSWLAHGAVRAIEGRLAVAPAAHESADLPGHRLYGDHRGLHLAGALGSILFDAPDPLPH